MRLAQEKQRRPLETIFRLLCLASVVAPILIVALLLGDLLWSGASRIDLAFLTSYPSRKAALAGILPGLVGSVYLIVLTILIALPVGVGAAIFLEEYGRDHPLAGIIEVNIANLAGVPSVIYGLLGLGLFVRALGMGRSILAGACTLALLVLPVIIVSAREALRTVPRSLWEASLALGATRWQTIRQVVLPVALPGITTGAILAIARAFGETAPLIVVGALTFVAFLPTTPTSPFTTLTIQIFNWVSRPQKEFAINAAAGIVVLLVLMLLLNLSAAAIRYRFQKRRA